MKIIINTAIQRFGGAVQGVLSFIYECRKYPEHEYHVFIGPGIRQSLYKDDFPSNFHFYDFDFGTVSFRKTFIINRKLRELEAKIRPDCIIATAGPTYFHSEAPQIIGFNLGLYIYPESPFMQLMSPYHRFRWFIKRKLHFYYFKRDASGYVVQTDDVNRRVRKALKTEQVFTVSNTFNGLYNQPEKFPAKLPPKGNKEIRLLTISAYYRHKNFEIIPCLVDELKKRGINHVKFVLTIDHESYDRIFGDEYEKEVVTTGPVKPEECPSLYKECDIMFLPTLAECFSASYPEAMVMGKPIVTTDLGFAHSICGDAALYYEALNPFDAANKITELIGDNNLKEKLITEGKNRLKLFNTAEERAKKYLNICKNLIVNR